MARAVARQFVRGPRRATAWDAFTPFHATVGSGAAVLIETQTPAVALTVVRLRGELLVMMDTSTGAAGEFAIVGLGIAVVNAATATAGVASLPTPVTDAEWGGWLWHAFVPMGFEPAAAGATGDLESRSRVVIDNKAMRKLSTDDVMVLVAENGVLTGAFSVEIFGGIRFLSKQG